MGDIKSRVRSLKDFGGRRAVPRHLRRCARAGEIDELLEFAATLHTLGPRLGLQRRDIIDGMEAVLQALAYTPSLECAAAALTLLERFPETSWPPQRLALHLSAGQTRERCLELIERAGDELGAAQAEALACWIHERILRHDDMSNETCSISLRELLRARGHPLACLPLARLASEVALREFLPHVTATSSGYSSPFGYDGADLNPPPAPRCRAREVEAPAELSAAIRWWSAPSNGTIEARAFVVDAGAEVDLPLLASLPLQCTEDARAMRLRPLPCARALALLFAAACNGGAYTRGVGPGWARLYAWRSLGALIDAPPDAPPEAVEALAQTARLFAWDIHSPWFARVAWDLALVATRDRGDETLLTVLAASDTD
ncbi:MAG: hypothetical protein KC636_04885 [Myxococcales bacterium]|nr:hypothetical protein [Myxococcales bacterium]